MGGGLISFQALREGKWGGGAYLKSHIFDEMHNNFPNFTISPMTKTVQEIGFVSPFYKYNVIYTLLNVTSRSKDQVSIESDCSILTLISKRWSGGLIERGGGGGAGSLLQNLTAKGVTY